jgi:glycosyltransferase involved in cell wall biosynthesis
VKRVLLITENLFPLGRSQTMIQRALDLAASGADIHIAAFTDRHWDWIEPGRFKLHNLAPSKSCSKTSSASPDRVAEGPFDRRSLQRTLRLHRLIRNLNPDLIEAWGEAAASIAQLASLGLSSKLKHGCEWIYVESWIPPFRRNFKSAPVFGAARFSRARVPHESLKHTLLRQGFSAPIEIVPNSLEPLRNIPHFQNPDRASSRKRLLQTLGLPESHHIAGTVASLISKTRLKDLIWATDLLTVVRDDFHLAIFGCGWQYERLKRFAGFTEAESHVHFLGEPEMAWPLFQGLDFYWHSHRLEPLPVNILAAMDLGIPVICVRSAATEELILHQTTGFNVNFGGRDEFARWTKYLIEQEENAKLVVEQARRFVQKHFGQPAGRID